MLLALAMLVLSFHVFLPLTHIYAGMSYDRFVKLQSTLLITHILGIIFLALYALIGAETANYIQVGVAAIIGAITWVLTRSQPDKSATWAFLLLGLFAIAGLTTQGIVIGAVIIGIGLLFPRLLQLGPENHAEEKPVFAHTAETTEEAPSPFTYEGTTAVNDAFVTPPVDPDEPSTRMRGRRNAIESEEIVDEPVEEPYEPPVAHAQDTSFDELLQTLNQPDDRFAEVAETSAPAEEPTDFNALLDELNKPDPRFDDQQDIKPKPDPTAFIPPPLIAEPDVTHPTAPEDHEPVWEPEAPLEEGNSQLFIEPDEEPYQPSAAPEAFDTSLGDNPFDTAHNPFAPDTHEFVHEQADVPVSPPFDVDESDAFIHELRTDHLGESIADETVSADDHETVYIPETYESQDTLLDESVVEDIPLSFEQENELPPIDDTPIVDEIIFVSPSVEDPVEHFPDPNDVFAEPTFPDIVEPTSSQSLEPSPLYGDEYVSEHISPDVEESVETPSDEVILEPTGESPIVDELFDEDITNVDDQASQRASVVEGLLGVPGQSPTADVEADEDTSEDGDIDRVALFTQQTPDEPSTRGRNRSTIHTVNDDDPSDALSEPVDDDMGTGGQRALSTRGRGGRHVRNPLAPIKSTWQARTQKEGDAAHADKSIYTFRKRGQQLDVELDAPVVRQLAISDTLPTLAEPVLRDESINPWLAGEAYVVGESTDPWERHRDWHHMDRLPPAPQTSAVSLEAPPLGHGHYIHRLRQPTFFDII